jgi:tetratricopeptide (TPR) repeat protein
MVQTNQNLDVALSYAQAARRAMPNAPNTADTLAWVYYHKGDYAGARGLLEDAVKIAPNDPSIHYHLGMTYSKIPNKKADAAAEFTKAKDLAPNSDAGKSAAKALSSGS